MEMQRQGVPPVPAAHASAVRPHSSSVEGAWSLFKRSVIGAYHQVSCKHLPAYLDELEFRFNNRDNPYIFRDAMRAILAAGDIEHKELVS